MDYYIPIEPCKNKLHKKKIPKYLIFGGITVLPLASSKLIAESTPLDNTKIIIIYLRPFASIPNERALKNPAIGALIWSL
jgi:hypothetical protein